MKRKSIILCLIISTILLVSTLVWSATGSISVKECETMDEIQLVGRGRTCLQCIFYTHTYPRTRSCLPTQI